MKKIRLMQLKYLIEECKVDPNIEDRFENTPLHYASTLDIKKYLVKCK